MTWVAGLAVVASAAVGCGDDAPSAEPTDTARASTSTTASTSSTVVSTTAAPTDSRTQLALRLGEELDDAVAAQDVVDELDDGLVSAVEAMTGDDIAGSPTLDYAPATVPADEVDSLWIFSYGFRFAGDDHPEGIGVGDEAPPMDQLVPGPTNEALAREAAAFVAEHPVPIIAQWEVAQVLADIGVPDVISVEPDVAADGTVTYLSTAGVAENGKALAAAAGVDPGHAGVLCFADHAVRCLMTAEAADLDAAVPEGVALPTDYDPESGQTWTRSVETWIPVDLLGRTILVG